MEEKTTEQVRDMNLNPTGKGGFGDNPQNINKGGWKKTETFRYWFGIFKDMTVEQFENWQKENPKDKRTVASELAFSYIVKSRNDLKSFIEVSNRSEGMPKQVIETGTVTSKYEEYLEQCKENGIDPNTGLRLENPSK